MNEILSVDRSENLFQMPLPSNRNFKDSPINFLNRNNQIDYTYSREDKLLQLNKKIFSYENSVYIDNPLECIVKLNQDGPQSKRHPIQSQNINPNANFQLEDIYLNHMLSPLPSSQNTQTVGNQDRLKEEETEKSNNNNISEYDKLNHFRNSPMKCKECNDLQIFGQCKQCLQLKLSKIEELYQRDTNNNSNQRSSRNAVKKLQDQTEFYSPSRLHLQQEKSQQKSEKDQMPPINQSYQGKLYTKNQISISIMENEVHEIRDLKEITDYSLSDQNQKQQQRSFFLKSYDAKIEQSPERPFPSLKDSMQPGYDSQNRYYQNRVADSNTKGKLLQPSQDLFQLEPHDRSDFDNHDQSSIISNSNINQKEKIVNDGSVQLFRPKKNYFLNQMKEAIRNNPNKNLKQMKYIQLEKIMRNQMTRSSSQTLQKSTSQSRDIFKNIVNFTQKQENAIKENVTEKELQKQKISIYSNLKPITMNHDQSRDGIQVREEKYQNRENSLIKKREKILLENNPLNNHSTIDQLNQDQKNLILYDIKPASLSTKPPNNQTFHNEFRSKREPESYQSHTVKINSSTEKNTLTTNNTNNTQNTQISTNNTNNHQAYNNHFTGINNLITQSFNYNSNAVTSNNNQFHAPISKNQFQFSAWESKSDQESQRF